MAVLNITVQLRDQFDSPKEYGKIEIDSFKGPSIETTGKLYPADIIFLNKLLEIIKEQKDRYSPQKRENQNVQDK